MEAVRRSAPPARGPGDLVRRPTRPTPGSPKPQLASVTYYAYTDDATEYGHSRAASSTSATSRDQDLAPVAGGPDAAVDQPARHLLHPGAELRTYGIEYLQINFNNPTLGPAFRQLYVRQALQELIDQEGMVKSIRAATATRTRAACPSQPANPWTPAIQNSNGGQGPYPFSVANATLLLTSHGWRNVGGVHDL